MSVRVDGSVIHVEGDSPVEDAEPILAALVGNPSAVVDLSRAAWLHGATVQLLVALRPRITGAPSDPFQAAYIIPHLNLER